MLNGSVCRSCSRAVLGDSPLRRTRLRNMTIEHLTWTSAAARPRSPFAASPSFACVEPDALHGHRLLDHPQHGPDAGRELARIVENRSDGGVLRLDTVAHALRAVLGAPCLRPGCRPRHRDGCPRWAKTLRARARVSSASRVRCSAARPADVPSIFGCRSSSRRRPCWGCRVGFVRAGEPPLSSMASLAEPEPAPGDQQSLVAVDVKALLRGPAIGPAPASFCASSADPCGAGRGIALRSCR